MNTDWNVQEVITESGGRVELRYDDLNQDQLQEGNPKVSVASVPSEHEELLTRNRSLLASFDDNFGSGWGISAIVRIASRSHSHVDSDSGDLKHRKFTGLSDIRVAGR